MREIAIIKKEWLKQFDLTALSNYKYYKIVGCLILGFELIRTKGELQPHFVIYPLWKDNVKECFGTPYVLHCIENDKGIHYQISEVGMLSIIDSVFFSAKKYIGFNIVKDVVKKNILNLINQEVKTPISMRNPRVRGVLWELTMYISIYLNDEILFNDLVVEIKDTIKYLDIAIFERRFGSFDKWMQGFNVAFENRETVLKKICENIENSKIKEKVELLP